MVNKTAGVFTLRLSVFAALREKEAGSTQKAAQRAKTP